MNWIVIIGIAIIIEVVLRYFTRNMENKKKRERILASIWIILGVALFIVWLTQR